MPTEGIPVTHNTPLYFSFPKIKEKLKIDTGANFIKWSYNLNTQSQSTYGGEVIQILSANVGPMSIGGNSRDNPQLKQIYDWFRKYMAYAGYHSRSESPVLFEYPERGWAFNLQINQLPDFHYEWDEIAIQWNIVAEVYQDEGIQALGKHTMSVLTKSLEKGYLQDFGWSASDIRIDPGRPENQLNYQQMGDNFHRLIASYVAGDFGHWGFDVFADPDSQFPGTAEDIYKKYFGSAYIIEPESNSSSGSDTLGSDGQTSSRCGIAHTIKDVFEAKGIPGQLGVAVAIQESNLDPDARQSDGDHAVGLFQTFPTGAGGSRSYSRQLKQAFDAGNKKVTDTYTAQMQMAAASEWFASAKGGRGLDDKNSFDKMAGWAQDAQKAGVDYRTSQRFKQAWQEAGKILSEDCPDSSSAGQNDAPGGYGDGQLKTQILQDNRIDLTTYSPQNKSDIQNGVILNKTMKGMLLVAEEFDYLVTALKSNHGIDGPNGHNPGGKAVDIGRVNGTITADNAETSTFMKWAFDNKTALGWRQLFGPIAKYNYVSPTQQYKNGTVYPGHTNHVHMGW